MTKTQEMKTIANTVKSTIASRFINLFTAALYLVCIAALFGCATTGQNKTPPPPRTDPLQTVSAQTLFTHGQLQAQQGDLVRAEQYFLAAQTKGYPESQVVPRLIEVCLVASRYRAALQYAEPYLEKHPDDHQLRTVTGAIYLALGQPKKASDILQNVITQGDEQPFALYLLAVIARDSEHDGRAAKDLFLRYLEKDPHGKHAAEANAFIRNEDGKAAQKIAQPLPRRISLKSQHERQL